MHEPRSSSRPWPVGLRILLVPVVAAALIAIALLLVRALVRGSEESSIAVTVVVLLGGGSLLGRLVKGRADLRTPVRVATIGAGVLVLGWYVASLRGEDVQEQLVAVPPAAPTPQTARGNEERPVARGAEAPRRMSVRRGRFRTLEHAGSGTAEIVRIGDRALVQLRNFRTDPGPDLRLYLATDAAASDFVDLGALKGNSGNQRYDVPGGTVAKRFDTVLVWCRAFSVPFTAAELA